MKKKVSPIIVILALVAALAVVGLIGYRMILAPKPTLHGIGRNGQPMTDADVDALARGMSGGKLKGAPPGSMTRSR